MDKIGIGPDRIERERERDGNEGEWYTSPPLLQQQAGRYSLVHLVHAGSDCARTVCVSFNPSTPPPQRASRTRQLVTNGIREVAFFYAARSERPPRPKACCGCSLSTRPRGPGRRNARKLDAAASPV